MLSLVRKDLVGGHQLLTQTEPRPRDAGVCDAPLPWWNFRIHLAFSVTINGSRVPNSPLTMQSIYLLKPSGDSMQKDWQHCSHCLKVPLCVENCLNGGIMNNHQIGAFSSWEERKAWERSCHMTQVISWGGEAERDSVRSPSPRDIGPVRTWSIWSLSLCAIYLVTSQGILG